MSKGSPLFFGKVRMKYKVIGWTWYDNDNIEASYCSPAAREAIIEDIRAHHYEFTGYNHQEFDLAVPVLNDGKMRCFTQRAFGQIMARAHGNYSYYGYCGFDIERWSYKECKMPPERMEVIYPSDIEDLIETDLSEEFEIDVTSSQFEDAINVGKLVLPHRWEYRYMDEGDTLILKCETEKKKFIIDKYERKEEYVDIHDRNEKPTETSIVMLKPKKD